MDELTELRRRIEQLEQVVIALAAPLALNTALALDEHGRLQVIRQSLTKPKQWS